MKPQNSMKRKEKMTVAAVTPLTQPGSIEMKNRAQSDSATEHDIFT
jgi:hypothetical protein